MDGILAARNPLNVLRTTVAPALRRVEQERPNVIPGILAGALESWPVFNPTVGGVLNPSEAGKAIVGAGLWDQLQAMDRMPANASLQDWQATQGPLQQAIMESPMANPFMAGMTVYHGSPHRFDRFDLSKVGTGEGAQAYGHGIYFAEAPEVAGGYRTKLTHPSAYTVDGVVPETKAEKIAAQMFSDWKGREARIGIELKADKSLSKIEKEQVMAAVKRFQASGARVEPPGSLYTVDIPDELLEGRLLDWDAPLSEQPEAVRKAVNAVAGYEVPGHVTGMGAQTNAYLNRKPEGVDHQGLQKWFAEEARRAGLVGIKYLDGQSRGSGEGTRNLVIWAQDILDKASVLRK